MSEQHFQDLVPQMWCFVAQSLHLQVSEVDETCLQDELSSSPLSEVQKALSTLDILGSVLVVISGIERCGCSNSQLRQLWLGTAMAHLMLFLALDAQSGRCLIQRAFEYVNLELRRSLCHPGEFGQLPYQVISLIEWGAMLLLDFVVSSCPGQNSPWNFLPYLLMAFCHAAQLFYRSFNSMSQQGES